MKPKNLCFARNSPALDDANDVELADKTTSGHDFVLAKHVISLLANLPHLQSIPHSFVGALVGDVRIGEIRATLDRREDAPDAGCLHGSKLRNLVSQRLVVKRPVACAICEQSHNREAGTKPKHLVGFHAWHLGLRS